MRVVSCLLNLCVENLLTAAGCLPWRRLRGWLRPRRWPALRQCGRCPACSSAEEAARDADIICTLTPSPTPILESGWVQPGAHINAVGACSATTRELNSALVARCRLYGDSIESVEKESGDYLIPLSEGAIQKEHLLGTIGQLLCGEITGRTSAQDVTVFDALGLAIEDIACAKHLYLAGKGEN